MTMVVAMFIGLVALELLAGPPDDGSGCLGLAAALKCYAGGAMRIGWAVVRRAVGPIVDARGVSREAAIWLDVLETLLGRYSRRSCCLRAERRS